MINSIETLTLGIPAQNHALDCLLSYSTKSILRACFIRSIDCLLSEYLSTMQNLLLKTHIGIHLVMFSIGNSQVKQTASTKVSI